MQRGMRTGIAAASPLVRLQPQDRGWLRCESSTSPAAPGSHLPPCHDHKDIPLGSADPGMPQGLHTVQGIPAGCREPPLQGAAGSPWVPPLAEVAWGIHHTPWQLPTLPGLITTGVISHLATKSSMEYLIINHLMFSLSLLFFFGKMDEARSHMESLLQATWPCTLTHLRHFCRDPWQLCTPQEAQKTAKMSSQPDISLM